MSPAVFGHGHLRLYLLYVLDERPMHGYEIIQALSDRFGGTYVPSAGTIYPRLAKLETEGLVSKESDGRKTVYAITDAGRAELNDRRDELDGIEAGLGDSVRRLADEVRASVGEAMGALRAELAAAAREARDDARASSRDAWATDSWATGSRSTDSWATDATCAARSAGAAAADAGGRDGGLGPCGAGLCGGASGAIRGDGAARGPGQDLKAGWPWHANAP